MSTHFFVPDIVFRGPSHEPVVAAIADWEAGKVPGSQGIQSPAGGPLPRLRLPTPGEPLHRYGNFRADPRCAYSLRLEVEHSEDSLLHVGVHLRGPGDPIDETRAGGPLVTSLLSGKSALSHEALPPRVRRADDEARAQVLMDRIASTSRQSPLVVVSCLASGDAGLKPDDLVTEIGGMAQVWSIGTREASLAFADAFAERKLDRRWSCYDGGVRVYGTHFDATKDELRQHPLLLRRSYEPAGGDAERFAVDWLRRMLLPMLDEQGWKELRRRETMTHASHSTMGGGATLADVASLRLAVRHLYAADEKRAEAHSDPAVELAREESGMRLQPTALPPHATVPGADDVPPTPADVELAEPPAGAPPDVGTHPEVPQSSNRSTDAPLVALQRRMTAVVEELAKIEDAVRELTSDLEVAEQGRLTAEQRATALEQQLNEVSQGLPIDVGATLRVLAEQFADQLEITKYAHKHAARSGFRKVALLSQVVACIALGQGEFGSVDRLVAAVGSRAGCSPKDSKETMKAFGKERQFTLDDGMVVECQQHVTIGHGQRNPNETLHIYFRRHGAKAQILYVGEHLSTVSGNT